MPELSAASAVEPSRIRAIAVLAEAQPDALRLFVGEDSLPTPDFIKEAALAAIRSNQTYYTPNRGCFNLRESLAAHLLALHGVPLAAHEQLIITSSGMNAIVLAVQATLGPGTSALVVTPLWPNMVGAIRVTGARAIEVPLDLSQGRYQLDLGRLEAARRPDTRLVALASPGNPTGWTATRADWEQLAAFCERHNLWLLADSVYERIVHEGTAAPSPLAIPDAAHRLLVVNSLSKTYRMTGWRIGWVAGPAPLIARMSALQEFVVSCVPGFVQEAARVAIDQGEPHVLATQHRYARHARIALDALGNLDGVTCPRPVGGFYVFPRLEGLRHSMGFCEHMLRTYGLGLAPGSAFGAGGEGHVRICFAVDESILREALTRFREHWRACVRSG